MVASIVTTPIVTHPLAVVMDVRDLWMPLEIAEIALIAATLIAAPLLSIALIRLTLVRSTLFWRALLGVAEASGVSAVGKAVGLYLLPKERAVGSAMGQLGLSLGAGLAPGVDEHTAASIALLDRGISYWSLIAIGLVVYPLSRRK